MNKVYKLVWSKVRNCYVAVAEIAKSHSKDKKVLLELQLIVFVFLYLVHLLLLI